MRVEEMAEQYCLSQDFLDVIEELYPEEFEQAYEKYKSRKG